MRTRVQRGKWIHDGLREAGKKMREKIERGEELEKRLSIEEGSERKSGKTPEDGYIAGAAPQR